MRAVRNTPDGPAVLEVPEPDGPGLVRVDVVASGICSSDLLGIDMGPEPITLGHEFSARTTRPRRGQEPDPREAYASTTKLRW